MENYTFERFEEELDNGYQMYYTYVRNRYLLFKTAENCYTQKLLTNDKKNPQPRMLMLTLKRVKEILKTDEEKNISRLEITIHEGKNHEVKRIFESAGYNVIKLKRESYAFLTLDNLKSGEYRILSIKEVKKLYSLK